MVVCGLKTDSFSLCKAERGKEGHLFGKALWEESSALPPGLLDHIFRRSGRQSTA